MRKLTYLAVGVLALLMSFAAGTRWSDRGHQVFAEHGEVYTCPMHPQYTSARPGDCPLCGMRLVPAADSRPTADSTRTGHEAPPTVFVPADTQRLIGVRSEAVVRDSIRQVLRVTGRVAVDENRSYQVIAASEGWTRRLGANAVGTFVRRGEVLASYYAPNLQAAQQALLFNLLNSDQVQVRRADAAVAAQGAPVALNLQIAIDTLRGLGMSDRQISEVQRTRRLAPEVLVYAPVTGFVMARNLSPEQRFEKNAELYRIADLSHVWVMADVLENDRDLVAQGATATVVCQAHRLEARMSGALPQFEPQSRTLKARFEVDNPGDLLRPDMFVDVEIAVAMPLAVTVSSDAVVDSGLHKTAFVDRGDGYFEAREVETGWRAAGRVEILRGLREGERVAAAANFLLDSESRMRSAVSQPAMPAPSAPPAQPATAPRPVAKDVVCGMEVDPADAAAQGRSVARGGTTYVFCSDDCKRRFTKDPEKYLGK